MTTPTLSSMPEDQARKLMMILLAGAVFAGALCILAAMGFFGAESRGVLALAFGLAAVGDLAFAAFVWWRRRQAAQTAGMYK